MRHIELIHRLSQAFRAREVENSNPNHHNREQLWEELLSLCHSANLRLRMRIVYQYLARPCVKALDFVAGRANSS